MWNLIIGLLGRLKYNHGLKGVADKCSACVRGFIRVGLKSAVIRIIYNRGLRSVADKCSACVRGFIRVGLKSAVIRDALGRTVKLAGIVLCGLVGVLSLSFLPVHAGLSQTATFTDVTSIAGVGGTEDHSNGAAWGDYDNDGDLDLYVATEPRHTLYRNDGDGTFADVTVIAGVGDPTATGGGAAWGDYDNDGDLDLYVGYNNGGDDTPVPNILYRNNGDGTFTDVTATAGVGDEYDALGVAWGDYDNDGNLDLYVANEWGGSAEDVDRAIGESNPLLFL